MEKAKKAGFRERKPLHYSVLIVTIIAVLCGAVLGLANYFLKVESGSSEGLDAREELILSIIAPKVNESDGYGQIDLSDTGVFGANITADLGIFKVKKAFRTTGESAGTVILWAEGVGYQGGALQIMTAFKQIDGAGVVSGMRPYTSPADAGQTLSKPFNQAFCDSFKNVKSADLAALWGKPSAEIIRTLKISSDTWSGATASAGSMAEGSANAARFYEEYADELHSGTSSVDPLTAAVRELYPAAARNVISEENLIDIDLPEGIFAYRSDVTPVITAEVGEDALLIMCFNTVNGIPVKADGKNYVLYNPEGEVLSADELTAAEALITETWNDSRADFFDLGAEKATLEKMLTDSGETGEFTLSPVLGVTIDGGNRNSVLWEGANYPRLIKATVGANEYYISAAVIEANNGPMFVYTLIKGGKISLIRPDKYSSREMYGGFAGYFLNAEGNYKFSDKYTETLDGEIYVYATEADAKADAFKIGGAALSDAEVPEYDFGGIATSQPTNTYVGISYGISDCIKAYCETLSVGGGN